MSEQCGTTKGYFAHLKLGEPTCQPCRDAQAAYMRDWRERTGMVATRRTSNARSRALSKLARMYPRDYQRLYRAELPYQEGPGDDQG